MIRAHAAVRAVLLSVLLVVLAACGSGDDEPDAGTTKKGQCAYSESATSAVKEVDLPPSDPPSDLPETLTISTSSGDIEVELEANKAPCAVNSFVSLADQGFFDDTTCHRLTTQGYFVLQCGDPTGSGTGGPGYTFADELVDDDPRLQPCGTEGADEYCTYNTGTVAMANSGVNTNGSQFFLVYGNSRFPPSYTVFGHMDAAGVKVVSDIAARGVTNDTRYPGDGTPAEPVTISSVE